MAGWEDFLSAFLSSGTKSGLDSYKTAVDSREKKEEKDADRVLKEKDQAITERYRQDQLEISRTNAAQTKAYQQSALALQRSNALKGLIGQATTDRGVFDEYKFARLAKLANLSSPEIENIFKQQKAEEAAALREQKANEELASAQAEKDAIVNDPIYRQDFDRQARENKARLVLEDMGPVERSRQQTWKAATGNERMLPAVSPFSGMFPSVEKPTMAPAMNLVTPQSFTPGNLLPGLFGAPPAQPMAPVDPLQDLVNQLSNKK